MWARHVTFSKKKRLPWHVTQLNLPWHVAQLKRVLSSPGERYEGQMIAAIDSQVTQRLGGCRFRPLRTLWKHWSDHSRTISKQHKGRQLGFVKMQAQLFFKNLQMYIRWTHTNSPPTHLIHYYYCCSSFNVPCVLLVKLFKIYLGQDEAPVLTP